MTLPSSALSCLWNKAVRQHIPNAKHCGNGDAEMNGIGSSLCKRKPWDQGCDRDAAVISPEDGGSIPGGLERPGPSKEGGAHGGPEARGAGQAYILELAASVCTQFLLLGAQLT